MENLNKNSSLHIDIFRHGQAKYEQGEVEIKEADDLTKEGIREVKISAEKLADFIRPDEEVEIWSSPRGRTLQTAKIIAETLEQKGIHLRKKGNAEDLGIKVFDQLGEIKNFSWKLFNPLVVGGEVELDGKKFIIDKNLTNPRGIDYQKYFTEDGIKNITPEARAELPADYIKEIEGFEKFIDATKRMIKPLSRLKKIKDKSYRIIIVTHDALTSFAVSIFSTGERGGLDPGEFLSLERKDDKIVVEQMGELKKGSDSDIIDEFNKKYKE